MLDGVVIEGPEPLRYYALHKMANILSSVSDDRGRNTVTEFLPEGSGRCVPIGRLDYKSEGLLLLTNDGPLVSHAGLMRSSDGWSPLACAPTHVEVRPRSWAGLRSRMLASGPVRAEVA